MLRSERQKGEGTFICIHLSTPLVQVSISRDTPPTDKDGGNFHDSDVSDTEGNSEVKEQASSAEAKLADDEKVREARVRED